MSEKQDIDWQAVHQQLATGGQLLETAFEPSPETVDKILAQRAEQLAQRQHATKVAQSSHRTVLLLEVGTYTAGIEIQWIQEVVNLERKHAPVPDAHELLLGVINVHNQLACLVNPWLLMNEKSHEPQLTFPQAVFLRHANLRVAIGCTRTLNLVELAEESWQSDRLFLYGEERKPGVLLDIRHLMKSLENQQQH